MAVVRSRAQDGRRCQVQRAAVLDVQPVVVVGVQRAGDFQPPLQDLVGRDLRHRGMAADVRRAGAVHPATGPAEGGVDVEIAGAQKIGSGQRQQSRAANDGIAGQRDVAVAQGKGAGPGQIDIDRHFVADVAVRQQVQRAICRDIDFRTGDRREARGAGGTGLQIDVAVVRRAAQSAGCGQVQRAASLDVEPVVVVRVERAADFEPALQEFVGVRLRQRREPADARDAAAAHRAARPDEAAVDVEISASAKIRASHCKQAGAADR